jgi:hypothetical protein
MITNYASCTREVKSRFPWQNQHSTGRKTSFLQQIELNLRKKLVNCYIWSIACYGVEAGTLRKIGQKYLESLIFGAGKRWRRLFGQIV